MENSTDKRFVEDPPDLSEAIALVELMRSVSGRWKLAILWSLMPKPLRFGEMRRANPGISQSVLTHQLRDLEQDGFVQRTVFPESPPRVEYELTEAAWDMRILLDAFQAWHRKHKGPSRPDVVKAARRF